MLFKSIHFLLRWEFLTLSTANVRMLVEQFVEKLGTALGGYCADPIMPVVKDDYDDDLEPREALDFTVFVASNQTEEKIEIQLRTVATECLAVVVDRVEIRI